MKTTGTIAAAVLLAAAALSAAPLHPEIKDPAVYIPLREEMTRMEMKFVEVQILAAEDKVNFRAVQKALDEMELASKKIRKVMPGGGGLQEALQKLGSQLDGLQRDSRRRDLNALKGNLDRLFETCFKCHQTHAPMM
jgi:cytochrome c556